MTSLKVCDGQGWSFMGGKWTDGPGGEMVPPDGTAVEYLAVKDDVAYADFSASFRFKFRTPIGVARFMFRVQDSRRFYALDIPWVRQQSRGRHFWAGIVIADGTPLQRYLNFDLIPGVCARVDYWYKGRVEASGPRLRAWVDGRLVADVEDATYESGRVGFGGIATPIPMTCHFGSLEVSGEAVDAPAWPGLEEPPPHWITPCTETDPKTCQSYADLLQGRSGDLALTVAIGNPNWGEERRRVLVRSSDAGRTWSEPEAPMLQKGLGANFTREDGTWVCLFPAHPVLKCVMHAYESDDEGRTWTGPEPLKIDGEWPERWKPGGPSRPVRLHDGALILPVISRMDPTDPGAPAPYLCFCACFVLRSEDDGRTWSAPVWCDAHNLQPDEPLTPGTGPQELAGRYYELGLAEVRDNVLLGVGRPERDPYMWQIQSNDGGRTWEPAAIGPFPGYCASMTRTASGALVATTRFPHFTAHLSRDGGLNWGPPVIVDYARWAKQQAVEVEPDVVLVSYMGHCMDPGQADSRIARLRVTSEGLCLDH